MKIPKISSELLILFGGCMLFIPFLGSTHLFDWDEVNFAEASREMLLTHNYSIPQINFQPFWEKPPLFFWLQVLAMKIFGVNEFAARFPNAVCGIITLQVLYRVGKNYINSLFGWIWVLMYVASFLPQLYFKSGIIDPWFNLFIFLSIFHLYRYSEKEFINTSGSVFYAGLFSGLAIMTKGPVALLIIGLCYGVYMMLNRFRNFMKWKHIMVFLILTCLVGGIWFIALWLNGEQNIISRFFIYQLRLLLTGDAGHGGPFYYHFIILLTGCFPAASFSILSMRRLKQKDAGIRPFHRWMLILFWVVLIVFSFVKTKIIHYSSLSYFPLTFLAAFTFHKLYTGEWKLNKWSIWLQFITGLVLTIAFLAISQFELWKSYLLKNSRIDDQFTRASIQAHVSWSGLEIIPGLLFLVAVILFLIYSFNNNRTFLVLFFITCILAVNLAIVLIAPKVEPYSQGAMIEFCKSKQNERAIVETIGFRSYANLFYASRPPDLGQENADKIIKEKRNSNVNVYYAGRIQNISTDRMNPSLELMYAKNGFVFYRLLR